MPLSQLFRVGFQSLKEGVAVELAFKKSLWAQKLFRSWLWWGILCWEQESTKKRHMLKGYQRKSVVWLWRARLSGQGAQAAIPPRNAPSIWAFQPHDGPVSIEGSIGPTLRQSQPTFRRRDPHADSAPRRAELSHSRWGLSFCHQEISRSSPQPPY